MAVRAVLAIDQGTTATKSYLATREGRFSPCLTLEHAQIYPQPGWVEHDPETLLANVVECIAAAGPVAAVGIDNQGETVVAWDAESGRPLYNAIVWQDRRTADFVDSLKAEGAEALTLKRAGLPLDPYFSAPKLRWLIRHAPEARKCLQQGRLRLGTSDSFFLFRLTGHYATDVTTASRTSLMNLETCTWDPELCRLFDIPLEILPEIRPTTAWFGDLAIGARGTPVHASVVDQQAALFGHGCYHPGQTKVTFGTGVFALSNVGSRLQSDPASGILPTVAWRLADKDPVYAVDAGVYNAGSAVNWARNLGLFRDFSEIDDFHRPPAMARGLVFVPALSGLACPYWDRTAAGMWLGLSLETTRQDLCQALLEGIALRTAQVLAAVGRFAGNPDKLSVDGGLTHNTYFCQFLADVTGCRIVIPSSPDITAWGTACFALLGGGYVARLEDLPSPGKPRRIVLPRQDLGGCLRRFSQAVERTRQWHTSHSG